MQRSQWISVFTGVVAILLGVGYLILVQVLDWRGGEMLPAPVDLSLTLIDKAEVVLGAISNLVDFSLLILVC
jgi:hypothetical protein